MVEQSIKVEETDCRGSEDSCCGRIPINEVMKDFEVTLADGSKIIVQFPVQVCLTVAARSSRGPGGGRGRGECNLKGIERALDLDITAPALSVESIAPVLSVDSVTPESSVDSVAPVIPVS